LLPLKEIGENAEITPGKYFDSEVTACPADRPENIETDPKYKENKGTNEKE
jgi:hypothetical protein